MGLGGLLNRTAHTSWQPPLELDRYTVDGIMQFEGMARRLCWREPYDATREGFKLKIGTDDALAAMVSTAARDVGAIDNDGQRSGVLQAAARGRQWARGYGGSLIVGLFDDGRHYREPLDWTGIRTLRGIRVLDRHEAAVARWDENPRSVRLGKPEYWQITVAGVSQSFVHHSRVIQVQGIDLPPRVLYQRQGWGGSMLDLVWGAYRDWQASVALLPEFVSRLTQGVFKQQGLADAMMDNERKGEIVRRYETLAAAMGTLGEMAIDAETEGYEIMQRPVAGVGEVIDKLVEAFVAAGDMPRSLLLGETVGGLNTGENAGEVRAWYDYVASLQKDTYEPIVLSLLRWICAAHDGPTGGRVPADMKLEWLPLWQPTRAEDDAHDLSQAQRRQIDTMSAVVKPEEARTDPALVRLYPGFDPFAEPDVDPTASADDPEGMLEPIIEAPASTMPDEPLMDARTAGLKLGVGPATIRRMAVAGQIRAWRVGAAKRWRFAWSEIEAAVSGRVTNTSTAAE